MGICIGKRPEGHTADKNGCLWGVGRGEVENFTVYSM